jgi:hypothetical protein
MIKARIWIQIIMIIFLFPIVNAMNAPITIYGSLPLEVDNIKLQNIDNYAYKINYNMSKYIITLTVEDSKQYNFLILFLSNGTLVNSVELRNIKSWELIELNIYKNDSNIMQRQRDVPAPEKNLKQLKEFQLKKEQKDIKYFKSIKGVKIKREKLTDELRKRAYQSQKPHLEAPIEFESSFNPGLTKNKVFVLTSSFLIFLASMIITRFFVLYKKK